jgi:hypothetical protein
MDGMLKGRCISLQKMLAPFFVLSLLIAQLLEAANPLKPTELKSG